MAYYSAKILEEELKNKVREDWFGGFDGTSIHGKIDFSIAMKATALVLDEPESLYWAEDKAGTSHDIYDSITQLVLTIGKVRAPEKFLPPKYLGAFDAEKIAFLEYWRVADVFTQTDFNWNVTPSDHSTREFHHVHDLIAGTLDQGLRVFDYDADAKELARFIRDNFRQGDAATHRIAVTRNNVLHIYQKWREKVRPTIGVPWDAAKKAGILDADFFLADLLSKDGSSILDRLQVLLKSDHYVRKAGKDSLGFDLFTEWGFSDGQKAHAQFWNVYRRPPKREFWGAIIERRDQLVPQDIRETKGAFFTPRIWVEKSQEAIAEALGENWQDEYDVWVVAIYLAVRHCIEADWLNDRDQFLCPEDSWKSDRGFQLDCMAFTLFHGQNRISCKTCANHWIPFTEDEVGCTSAFASHFMSDWLRGKAPHELAQSPQSPPNPFPETSRTSREIFSPAQPLLFGAESQPFAAEADAAYDLAQSPPSSQSPILETSRTLRTSREAFSPAARAVFDAGRELWRYYHAQPNAMPDASLYDIREHFKGRKPNGHMNATSGDAGFNTRNNALISALKALAAQIATKVYEHGFLRN